MVIFEGSECYRKVFCVDFFAGPSVFLSINISGKNSVCGSLKQRLEERGFADGWAGGGAKQRLHGANSRDQYPGGTGDSGDVTRNTHINTAALSHVRATGDGRRRRQREELSRVPPRHLRSRVPVTSADLVPSGSSAV